MAFATIVASGSGQQAALTTNHNVDVPALPSAGNVLLVVIHTTGASNVVTPPAGFVPVGAPDPWGQLGQWQSTTGPWVFAKRTSGAETTPAVFTTAASAFSTHVWMEVSNVSNDALFDGIRITSATGASVNPNPPVNALPGTYLWNDPDVLYLAATSWTTAATTFTSHPASYTAVASQKVAAQGTGIAVSRRDVSALSEDPGTFAITAISGWVALTIAIRSNDSFSTTERVTQLLEEVAYEAEPALRFTQLIEEVAYEAAPALQFTQLVLEVAYIQAPVSENQNRRIWVGSWI